MVPYYYRFPFEHTDNILAIDLQLVVSNPTLCQEKHHLHSQKPELSKNQDSTHLVLHVFLKLSTLAKILIPQLSLS